MGFSVWTGKRIDGKVRTKENLEDYLENEGQYEHLECPPYPNYDLCDPEYMNLPNTSYRQGSWHKDTELNLASFFNRYGIKEFLELEKVEAKLIPIEPILGKINALPDKCKDEMDNNRMKWFKFCSNRAVELYGDEAVIQFSW